MRILARIRWLAAVLLFAFTLPAMALAVRQESDRTVNGRPFDPNRMDRVLMLGGVDEWTGQAGPYTVVVRTRYQRYIGAFVLHCHILDHEDQGMMQNIRVVLPDGKGGVGHGHH
jgi:FtsP/CotA-like multicopper oxidase with cupredoxin domain